MNTSNAPRSQALSALIMQAVVTSRMQWQEYADAVVAHYHHSVDVADRVVDFHVASTAAQHEKATRLNTQTVRRLLSGEIRMPVDLEEALVMALPREQRVDVLANLLARMGLMYARRPPQADDVVGQVGTPCELMRCAADAVQAIVPMLEDNHRIGPEDQQHFANALHAINDVQSACITLTAQIANAMPQTERARVLKAVQG
ncbi:hypothetical protein ACULMA_04780 [Xanthomonas arboricola pv. corylina]|uniref:hypothetical protein n=2 Tax=Xanthomonas arboricola TaxID=56448 RepID=UPI0040409E63